MSSERLTEQELDNIYNTWLLMANLDVPVQSRPVQVQRVVAAIGELRTRLAAVEAERDGLVAREDALVEALRTIETEGYAQWSDMGYAMDAALSGDDYHSDYEPWQQRLHSALANALDAHDARTKVAGSE